MAAIIQKPSATPVFADENWVAGYPFETDTPCRNLYAGNPLTLRYYGMGRLTIARHGGRPPGSAPKNVPPGSPLPGAINLGLADGHAELAPLEKLWNYSWHLNWQVPAKRPP